MESEKLLEIKNLHTAFRLQNEYFDAVDGVSLSLYKNEVLAIVDWQQYMSDQAVVAPTHFRIKLTAVNNRVTNWDSRVANTDWDWNMIGLSSDTPEKAN